MKGNLLKPSCIVCQHSLYYKESVPQKRNGVMMHFGEHFCTGGKRARRFKRSDPKVAVPQWCPKRKKPCELRIYGFKNPDEWYLHTRLCARMEEAISPSGCRYALYAESHIDLTPYEFWKQCSYEPYEDLLGLNLQLYEVAEIDDGLEPIFFYMTGKGLVVTLFDAETARKNQRE